MARKPQIPLKDVMAAVDKKDRGFYKRLNDEQKKAFWYWLRKQSWRTQIPGV